jgi:hypothetical protein
MKELPLIGPVLNDTNHKPFEEFEEFGGFGGFGGFGEYGGLRKFFELKPAQIGMRFVPSFTLCISLIMLYPRLARSSRAISEKYVKSASVTK